jgi:hypothetical protein
MSERAWLLLLYELPTAKNAERVNLWRKLKKFGALSLKTSAYLLPNAPLHFERFQWLSQQIRDGGGDATLIQVAEIENLTYEAVTALFNEARENDYGTLQSAIADLLKRKPKRPDDSFTAEADRLKLRFEEIRGIDFFDSPRSHDVEILLRRLGESSAATKTAASVLSTKNYRGKTWLTRPKPEIDRVGSAWLIRTRIDPDATFVFGTSVRKFPGAIPFDMVDVEFTHKGDDCTFETLLKRFWVEDKTLRKIGEMIHDADLEDDKFHRHECVGIDQMLKGWAKIGASDREILEKGFDCFDALQASLDRG